MKRYNELLKLVESFEDDFRKFYLKANKTAGVRLRKNMQELRSFAKNVRDEVQEINTKREETKKKELRQYLKRKK